MKPWKDFSKINLVFSLAKKYLEKSAFSFVFQCLIWRTLHSAPFLWASKENEKDTEKRIQAINGTIIFDSEKTKALKLRLKSRVSKRTIQLFIITLDSGLRQNDKKEYLDNVFVIPA